MKTAQDSYTITIKQIVRFQERMHLEKFQVLKNLDSIKLKIAACLSVIIYFRMPNILKTVLDASLLL